MLQNAPTLSGKTALITGAARRVGAQIARALHAAGMNIVLHYRGSAAEAETLADELRRRRGDSVVLAPADLLDTEQLPALIATAAGSWRGLDVLVNNASAFYPTPLGEISPSQWDEIIGANLKAPLFLSQAAAPHLRTSGGCIVNIVDIHAERPLRGFTVYCISKAGIAMLTRSLAQELGPEVRVNGIAPGAILWPEAEGDATDHQEIIERTALKRKGSPADIAGAVMYLVTAGTYVTGQILTVDGGRTLSN